MADEASDPGIPSSFGESLKDLFVQDQGKAALIDMGVLGAKVIATFYHELCRQEIDIDHVLALSLAATEMFWGRVFGVPEA